MEDYTKANMWYCPRCGMTMIGIGHPSTHPCLNCGCEESYEIPSKWGITNNKNTEMYDAAFYAEKTDEEWDQEWDEYCRPFMEEVVMQSPKFDPDAHRKLKEYRKEHRLMALEYIQDLSEYEREHAVPPKHKVMLCPYCNSGAVAEFTHDDDVRAGRVLDKKWHCYACKRHFDNPIPGTEAQSAAARAAAKSKPSASTIKCTYCGSTDTHKISAMSRMFSGGLFGFGSRKIGKQWHCNNCGSDF